MGPRHIDQEQLAAALNELMRRYIEEPDKFEREFQAVGQFVAQEAAGETPSYGLNCSAYLLKLSDELAAKAEG
jgi:hypothetical protein